MDNDLRISILSQNPSDPIKDVELVEPPHARTAALAVAVGAQVGREHIEACIVAVLGHVQRISALT